MNEKSLNDRLHDIKVQLVALKKVIEDSMEAEWTSRDFVSHKMDTLIGLFRDLERDIKK